MDDASGVPRTSTPDSSPDSTLDTTPDATAASRTGRRRLRGGVAVGLAVLCCVTLLASVVGVWARKTIFDTDYWVEQVTPLASNEEIIVVLGDYLTEQIVSAADLETRMRDALPPTLSPLAAPISSSARGFVRDQVDEVLRSEQFRSAWVSLNRTAHAQMVKLINGTGVAVQTDVPGVVSINLLPVINTVLRLVSERAGALFGRPIDFPEVESGELPEVTRARLSTLLGRELPADFGRIPVYEDQRLGAAQDALILFQKSVTVMIGLTLLFGAGAVALARRRIRMAIGLCAGLVLSLAFGRAAVNIGQRELLDLISDEDRRRAVSAIIGPVLSGFTDLATLLITMGVGLLVIAVLASDVGPIRAARGRVRGGATQVASLDVVRQHRNALALGGVAVAFVFLLLSSDPTWGGLAALVLVLGAFEAFVAWAGRAPEGQPIEVEVDPSAPPTTIAGSG